MKRSAKFFIILVLAGLLAGCAAGGSTTPTPSPEQTGSFQPVVSATGSVVPATWAALSMVTPGSVAEVLVKEGDVVKAGDVLVRLKGGEAARAALKGAELELTSAKQALKALNDNVDVARSQAELTLANAAKTLDKAKETRENKDYVVGDQEQVDIARANLVLAEKAVKDAEEVFDQFSARAEDNTDRAAALSVLANTRQRRDTAKANLDFLLKRPDVLDVNVAESQLQVAQANYDYAKRELDKLKNGPNPDSLALAQGRVDSAQTQVEAARATLDNLELKAPFAGTVSRLNVRAGEYAAPGLQVVLLADLNALQVETTDLNEIDMARVKVGDAVNVTFDALPDVSVPGKVSSISPKSAEAAGVNYTVTVKMDQIPAQLRWGMTAFVDITVSGN